jgi:amino acid transporter
MEEAQIIYITIIIIIIITIIIIVMNLNSAMSNLLNSRTSSRVTMASCSQCR